MKYPWNDPRGRFSPFKAGLLIAMPLPAFWVMWAFAHGMLGPRPLNAAIHEIGLWTIRLLFLSLLVTPALHLWHWPKLLLVRRMLGVGAFCYLIFHFVLYIGDQAWDLGKVVSEIVLRIYLTIGFVALLALLTLAATSTDAMVRKLGGVRWQRLHYLVYPVALLALIHHYMQSKVNVDEPIIMSGLFLWLLGWRIVLWSRGVRRPPPLWVATALSVAAGVITAFGEAFYYYLQRGVPMTRLLKATLAIDVAWRPAWYVLGITLLVCAIAGARGVVVRRQRLQAKAA